MDAGGHDIPEHKSRERYAGSRANLIKLIPHLASLRVFAAENDPKTGMGLEPVLLLLLHMDSGKIVAHISLDSVPQWAKPILAMAFETAGPAQ